MDGWSLHASTFIYRWRLGVVASVVRRMNEVTSHWARLVLGWVTVFVGYTITVCNQPTRLTQPCIPPGSLPASAGVKAGMSPLPGGRQHFVIPYGTWVPVAVRRVANCYIRLLLLLLLLLDQVDELSCSQEHESAGHSSSRQTVVELIPARRYFAVSSHKHFWTRNFWTRFADVTFEVTQFCQILQLSDETRPFFLDINSACACKV